MSTKSNLKRKKIGKNSPKLYSRIRTTIETAFYRNNVTKITSLAEAYELAKNSSGTIVSDLEVYRATDLGLPSDAKVLIFNDGIVTGRQAKVRQLINSGNTDHYSKVLRDSIFNSRNLFSVFLFGWPSHNIKFSCDLSTIVSNSFHCSLDGYTLGSKWTLLIFKL